MKELITLTLTVNLLTLNLIPFFIVLGVLFPIRLSKTQALVTHVPRRSFVIGLVNFIFLLALALILFSLAGQVNDLLRSLLLFPALIITVLLAIALSFGLCSLASLIGARLFPSQSTWRQTLWGTVLLGTGCSVPLAGWFLLLPYASWVGMGAFITSYFQKGLPNG